MVQVRIWVLRLYFELFPHKNKNNKNNNNYFPITYNLREKIAVQKKISLK